MILRLWLSPLADLGSETSLEFEVLDARRRVSQRGEAVIAELPRGMPCELLVHAFDALLVPVRLPRLSGAKLAAALPSLVEEYVTGDIERNHVVASVRGADQQAVAAVVDRALLARTLEIFKRAGLRVSEVTPALLALDWRPGTWRIRLRDGHGIVRSEDLAGSGFAWTGEVPVELQLLLGQSARPPEAIEVEGECDLAAWTAVLGETVTAAPPATQAPPVVLNLLQYGFSREVIGWKNWRSTLVLGAALVLVAVGGLNLSAWKMRAQEKTLRDAMAAIVKEAMPKVTVVLDPLAQMSRHVSDLRTGAGTDRGDFLTLASRFGALTEADSVQSIDYGGGQFKLRYRTPMTKLQDERKRLADLAEQSGITVDFDADGIRLARRKTP
ncbi:MAG: type II secretion system protein GspL [Burkholderiales bacterium]